MVFSVGVMVVGTITGTNAVGQTASSESGGSGGTPQTCAQWDVTGRWDFALRGVYTPSLILDDHDTNADPVNGVALTGVLVLPEGQWQNAGWTGPTNPFEGNLIADRLSFTVTAPHRDGFLSVGKYQGTVTDGRAEGTTKDLNALERGEFPWTAMGTSTCLSYESNEKDTERSLLLSLGVDKAYTTFQKSCATAGRCDTVVKQGQNAEDAFSKSICRGTPPCATPGASQEQKALPELMRFAVNFAGATSSDGAALFPGVRAILPVITRMAYHGATDNDPASAEAAASAAWRLFSLVSGMDADA